MGKGIIKANNGDGLYEVEIVYDRARIDAELEKLAENRAKLEEKLYTGTPAQDDLLRLQIASINKRINFINEHAPQNVVMSLFCADYTQDIPIDSVVGTIELARREFQILKPSEGGDYLYTNGMAIKPGFSAKSAYVANDDGILSPPVNQTPAQLFYNWAISPGSMKWKPRYRSAIIDSISGDTADITLTDLVFLTENKTEIDIDQPPLKKTSVPIEYMDCNGDVFLEGDEVVVQFTGMNWSSPKIIGFTGEPKECVGTMYYSVMFDKAGQVYSGFSPTTSSEIYEKLYFKIEPKQDPVWINESDAALVCNLNDPFEATKTREYSCISEVESVLTGEPVLFDCSETFTTGNDIQWAGSLDESYMPEEMPDGLGVITKQFVKNVDQLGLVDYSATYGGIYNVGGSRIFIFLTKMACGIVSPKSSKAFPNNSVRTLDTDVWPEGINGYYDVELILPVFEAVHEVVTFELGMAWFGCCDDPIAGDRGYLMELAPNWESTVLSAGITAYSSPVMYEGQPYYSPSLGCFECVWQYPADPNLVLDEYWVNGFNIYSGRTEWFGFTILDWPIGESDPQGQIPTYPSDLRTPYSDLDPFFALAIDNGVNIENIAYFKTQAVPYTNYGYGPTVSWQYSDPMSEVYTDRFGNPIGRTRETNIYTLEVTWGTAPLTIGGSLWLVDGVTRVPPQLNWHWGLFDIPEGWDLNDEDPPEKDFEDYPLAGENYTGATDDIIVGDTNTYDGWQEQSSERIVDTFFRKVGDAYRIVVNYRQRDFSGDLENRHFIAVLASGGTLESVNDYSGSLSYDSNAGDFYLQRSSWYPDHMSSIKMNSFIETKKSAIGALAASKAAPLMPK